MCFLCLRDNPFAINEINYSSNLKERAAQIKIALRELEYPLYNFTISNCESGIEQINKLKEEQYKLAKEI